MCLLIWFVVGYDNGSRAIATAGSSRVAAIPGFFLVLHLLLALGMKV